MVKQVLIAFIGEHLRFDFSPVTIKLSVVIPVHNEAPSLALLLPELKRRLDELFPDAHEILVVDDGSTDEIAATAQSAGVKLLHHAQRGGSGAARKTGSRAAAGEWIAWLDGDGTYPPEALVALLHALSTADQVIGARSTDYGRLRWLRLLVKGRTAKIASWFWRTQIPDLNSGLRVFWREQVMAWIDELPDGFSCTTTATLAALNHGQKIVFVPIDYRPRTAQTHSKFHPVWDTLRLWRTLGRMWCRRRNRRQLA